MVDHSPPPSAAPSLPSRCEVLVIGAGPAGSSCAHWLARAGRDVLLVDQHDFPRDKICGDGLIPDTHRALARLNLLDEVMSLATPAQHVRCVGTRGGHVDVPGTLAVLPRKTLDHVLVRGAVAAGARLATPYRYEGPLTEGADPKTARVCGARLRRGSESFDVQARWVVLATGAVPQALMASGVCERHTPSGIALRGYVAHPGLAATLRELQIVWHPRLRGGYGWIFPAPGGLFNIGAGLTGSHLRTRAGKGRMQDINLRHFFQAFCEVYAPAGELMRNGITQGEFKGAPLRCSLIGAQWSRAGMLVAGEAAGSTYAFSGEGIGKAMETGLLAAEALLASADDTAVRADYEAKLTAIKPKLDLYESASRVNHHPWLSDLVVWRARRSPRILRRMSGVLEETQSPGRLLSVRGITKLLLE